jgi:hypothetical protein
MRQLFLTALLIAPFATSAQQEVILGFLPEISVTHKFSNAWKFAGKVEQMHVGWRQFGDSDLRSDYSYLRTDISATITYQIDPLISLGGGYLLRLTHGGSAHRTIQQLGIVTLGDNFRLGHRIRMDQTFAAGEDVEFRLRYRLSGELPLEGLSINAREWYAVGAIEQLAGLQSGIVDWEQRLSVGLGHNFNIAHKLELGINYRLDRFINNDGRHRIWWTMSYYVNL